jgi:malonyl-CoA O-methyltransferase
MKRPFDVGDQTILGVKAAIASHFSRAAAGYDRYAGLQRDIGHQLMTHLPQQSGLERGLDLGCGTGYFLPHLGSRVAHMEALDLSSAMLLEAKRRYPQANFHQGDAESLPFEDERFDVIYSNLALQWCDALCCAVNQAWRCLRPNGWFIFSTLAEGTLTELCESWRGLDARDHVNRFLSYSAIDQSVRCARWSSVKVEFESRVLHYQHVVELLKDLKGIGANYVIGVDEGDSPHRALSGKLRGLTTPAQLKQLGQIYQQGYAQPQGLPASYQVVYCVMQK